MAFTELNAVEHYLISELTGVNLNDHSVAEPKSHFGFGWQYKSHKELPRGVNEVLCEAELKESLIRLNPEISQKNELADEVIYRTTGHPAVSVSSWPCTR